MNWLKALGTAVKVTSVLIPAYGPLIKNIIPGTKDDAVIDKASDTFEQIGGVVANAEIFGAALNLPGKDKLTGSAPAVAQLILRSSLLAGKKVKDPVRFETAVTGIASNVAELLSSVE